jgi:hypothetical protein
VRLRAFPDEFLYLLHESMVALTKQEGLMFEICGFLMGID